MDKLVEIQKLKSLLDQGAITDNEFQSLKRRVLDSIYQQDSPTEKIELPNDDSVKFTTIGNFGSVRENTRRISSPTVTNLNPQRKSQANSAAIIFAVASAIAVFLPWVEVSSSSSFGSYSSSYSSGGMSGISIGFGIAGLVMALIGGGLAIAGTKWASIFGIINLIDGIGYALGWFNAQGKASFSSSFGGSNYHAEAGVHPQYGLFLFIIASVLFIIFSLTHESESENNLDYPSAKQTYQGFNAFALPAKYTKKTNPYVFWVIILIILLLSVLLF